MKYNENYDKDTHICEIRPKLFELLKVSKCTSLQKQQYIILDKKNGQF